MNCNQIRDLLVESLLNELDDNTRSAVETHLQGCASCLALEKEISLGIDVLYSALPEDSLSSEQRSWIVAGAIAPSPRVSLRIDDAYALDCKAEPVGWRSPLPYLIAFAAGILLMTTVFPIHSQRESASKDPNVKSGPPSSTLAIGSTTLPKDSEISEERNAKTLLVAMQRTNTASMTEGHILWDALSHEVHFFGSGIASPPNGMYYVLWLMDQNNQPLATKELTLEQSGRCKATATSASNRIRFVYITLESKLGRFDRPSGIVELTLDTTRLNSAPL